jgi:hypothetical protein
MAFLDRKIISAGCMSTDAAGRMYRGESRGGQGEVIDVKVAGTTRKDFSCLVLRPYSTTRPARARLESALCQLAAL